MKVHAFLATPAELPALLSKGIAPATGEGLHLRVADGQ
jgi:hypothetical protein